MAKKVVKEINTKKLAGTKLFVIDVSAVMRTNYVPLSTGSAEDLFTQGRGGYRFQKRELSYEVNGETVNTSALYGLLRLLTTYGMENHFIFCFDTPKNQRSAEDSTYKAGRAKANDDYFDQVNIARSMLENVGFLVHSVPGYEADDFVVESVNQNKEYFDHVFVVSNDYDMAQNVDENVYFKNVMKSRGDIDKENYEEMLKCPYNSIVLYKSLVGDKSDNIAGVKGFGPKAFYKFVDQEGIYGDLPEMRRKRGEYEVIKNTIHLNEDQRKQALASLRMVVPRVPKEYANWTAKKNILTDMLKMYLEEYGMASIAKKIK